MEVLPLSSVRGRRPDPESTWVQRCFCVVILLLIFHLDPVHCGSSFATSHLTQMLSASSVTPANRIVNTRYGQLQGNLVRLSTMIRPAPGTAPPTTLSDVEAYLGVPYATPPTGGLRFMPPVTPSHWRGIRQATTPSAVCPQAIPADVLAAVRARDQAEARRRTTRARFEQLRRTVPLLGNQSEDCLYLNVYVPIPPGRGGSGGAGGPGQGTSSWSSSSSSSSTSSWSTSGPRLPVLVLLSGESYSWGAGSLVDGSLLAAQGQVLVVTLNARLGVLGFLPSFADGSIRGNYGLMDSVAALHWVQENVAEFGGEPANVTLLGHGHGAAMAHLLALSPMAKGLFSRLVLLSGSALSPWAIVRDPEHFARELGRKLNCTTLESMIDCLRSVPVSVLTSVTVSAPEHLSAFGPILDGIVVPADPRRLYQSLGAPLTNNSHHQHLTTTRPYDLLLGTTSTDCPCVFAEDELSSGLAPARRDRLLRSLVRNLYDYHQQSIYLTLHGEYAGWSDELGPSKAALDAASSVLADGLSLVPLLQTADLHSLGPENSRSQSGPSKTFFYVFDVNAAATADQELSSRFPLADSPPTTASAQVRCSSGAHLAYLLGDPLAQMLLNSKGQNSQLGPFWYEHNLTWAQAAISQMFMHYIAAFVRAGDPNAPLPHLPQPTPPRYSPKSPLPLPPRPFWPLYTPTAQTYLSLGSLTPIAASHASSHRLALWLQLIPRLLLDDREFAALDALNLSTSPFSLRPSSELSTLWRKPENDSNPGTSHHLLLEQQPGAFEGIVRTPGMIAASRERAQNAAATEVISRSGTPNQISSQAPPTRTAAAAANQTHVHVIELEAPPPPTEPPPLPPAHAPDTFGQFRHTSGPSADVYPFPPLLFALAFGATLLMLNLVLCTALCRQCAQNRKLLAAAQQNQQVNGKGAKGGETQTYKESAVDANHNRSTPTRKYRDRVPSPPRHLQIEPDSFHNNNNNGTLSRTRPGPGSSNLGPSYRQLYPVPESTGPVNTTGTLSRRQPPPGPTHPPNVSLYPGDSTETTSWDPPSYVPFLTPSGGQSAPTYFCLVPNGPSTPLAESGGSGAESQSTPSRQQTQTYREMPV